MQVLAIILIPFPPFPFPPLLMTNNLEQVLGVTTPPLSVQDTCSVQLHLCHQSFPQSKELTFDKFCCFGILKSLE